VNPKDERLGGSKLGLTLVSTGFSSGELFDRDRFNFKPSTGMVTI